jgi:hypothetical protein
VTFLRSGRSFLPTEAVSLKTPTMRWLARLEGAEIAFLPRALR